MDDGGAFRRPGVGIDRRSGFRGFGAGGLRPPIANSLAYWPMDGNLTQIVDYSGRGNHLAKDMLPAVSTVPFALGGNSADGTQQTTGRMAKWGTWKRALTSAEKAALAGGEGWPFSTTTSLRDASVYYLLDEASSATTFVDATSRGNDLTRTGVATTKVAGPLGTDFAVRFSGGTSVLLRNPVTADLQTGNTTTTTCGWVNLDALGAGQQVFWGQFDGGNRTGLVIGYHAGHNRLQCDYGNDVDLYRNAVAVADTFGAVSTGVWMFMCIEYSPSANTFSIAINNSAANVLSSIQQPLPVQSGAHISSQFRTNPDYRATNQSGWDLVGKYVTAGRAINADLSIGAATKAVWGWVKTTNVTPAQLILGNYDVANNHCDWSIQINAGNFYFVTGDNAGGLNLINKAIADTNWHYFIAWYDKDGDGKIHLEFDGVAATPVAVTHAPSTSSLPFLMGGGINAASQSNQFSGNLAFCGISTGVPTAADKAALLALGAGLT